MEVNVGPVQNRKAILNIVGWWPGKSRLAGIFIREHVEALSGQYQMIVVHCLLYKSKSLCPTIQIDRTMENGIPVHRIEIWSWLRRAGMAEFLIRRAYKRVIRRIAQEYDLQLMHIHVRTDESEQALYLASHFRLPVVITEHSSFYNLGVHRFSPRKWDKEQKKIRAWFRHPSIRKVMPVSHHLGDTLQDNFHVARKKIKVIPNIAASVFKPGNSPVSDHFQIMLAAYWRPPKDHDVFIDALKLLPPVLAHRSTVIWGGFGPHMEQIRERCSKELGNFDIRFPGYLDKASMAAWMQSSNVFVLPTKSENLPCVILESLSCGTPVISMYLNGIPEMVNESNGILVPPGDPNLLAEAIKTMMTSPERFDRDTIAADAFSRYSVEAVAGQIQEVYVEAIRDHRGE